MTKKKEYESKEYLIANFERIAAEMDEVHGPRVASPPRGSLFKPGSSTQQSIA